MKVVAITPNGKHDFITELVIEGLRQINCRILASDLSNGIDQKEVYRDQDIIEESRTADAVLFFFGKVKGNAPPKHYLIDYLKDRTRCAYIDGSEWSSTGYQEKNQAILSLSDPKYRKGNDWINKRMLEKCAFYFKRECYSEDADLGIIPFPFGLLDRNIPKFSYDKDIDISCVFGHTSTGLRKETLALCEKLKTSKYKVVADTRLPVEEYAATVARSKIVVDAWGGGDSCNRFYEAVGSKACCLYQRYNTIVPNPFIDMQHAVSYSSIEEFEKLLLHLLENDATRKAIAENGYSHAEKFHSAKARAQFVLSRILEKR